MNFVTQGKLKHCGSVCANVGFNKPTLPFNKIRQRAQFERVELGGGGKENTQYVNFYILFSLCLNCHHNTFCSSAIRIRAEENMLEEGSLETWPGPNPTIAKKNNCAELNVNLSNTIPLLSQNRTGCHLLFMRYAKRRCLDTAILTSVSEEIYGFRK